MEMSGASPRLWQMAPLPSTLSILHHPGRDRRRRARQGHSSVGVNNRDDFASPVGRLLVVDMIRVAGNTRVDVSVGLSGRQRDGRSHLLHRLDLVLQRRGVRRAAGKRGTVGGRVDGVQLQIDVNKTARVTLLKIVTIFKGCI